MLAVVGVHPMHNPPILPKPQLIQIPNRISKRNNIIPIPTVQMNSNRTLFNESFILVHTSQLIHVILVDIQFGYKLRKYCIRWDRIDRKPSAVRSTIILLCSIGIFCIGCCRTCHSCIVGYLRDFYCFRGGSKLRKCCGSLQLIEGHRIS